MEPNVIKVGDVTYIREDSALERWYSVAELSEMSGFTLSSIYRAMNDGRLAYKCPNNTNIGRRVSRSEWTRFLQEM